MNIRLSKAFKPTFTLMLTLGLASSFIHTIKSADNEKNFTQQFNNSQLEELSNNINWKKVCKFWKKLNHLSEMTDYQKIANELKNNKSEYQKISKNLNHLVSIKLLTSEEKNFLCYVFKQRLEHLDRSMGLTTCYTPSLNGTNIMSSRASLENNYDTLEKLHREGKISTNAYNTARNKLIEDFKTINDNAPDNILKNYQEEYIDLIILLNK